MPRNNSPERRKQRQEIARNREDRRKIQLANWQREDDNAVHAVLLATKQILDDEGNALNIPEYVRRHTHQCGNPGNCTMHPVACSAANQNMPAHLIVGQKA